MDSFDERNRSHVVHFEVEFTPYKDGQNGSSFLSLRCRTRRAKVDRVVEA